MKKILLCFCILAMITSLSCNDDETSNTPSGLIYSYFPVNVGHEVIYDVVHITKDDFNSDDDTAIYQVKEIIESQFEDNEGRTTQRIERYTRSTPNDPWVISDVWTSNLTPTRAEKKEENISYVKLVFPINTNAEWNGNTLNTLEPQTYSYMNIHESDMVGGITFDSTISVLQNEIDYFTNYGYEIEKFAPGVGLIYKQKDSIVWDNDNNIPPQNPPPIKSQDLYKETIVSWSN